MQKRIPDSKVHGVNMGPTWVLWLDWIIIIKRYFYTDSDYVFWTVSVMGIRSPFY